jgi:hypothetical protein
MEVVLGQDSETHQLITLGDVARCGRLYLLGKPRTGKSTLMISLALQDMEHGHGLLLIDPHSDAIAALLARIPAGREEDVILLDPSVDAYAFGINPLTCKNPNRYKELAFAYGVARDLFVKVFGDPLTGELGILLDKYLRNSLYPLLENPGHTLVDLRSFLLEKPFRNRLLQNVRMNRDVVRFWHGEFEQLPLRDQIQERESTLNRLNPILTDFQVKHMVGQVKTTIDFTEILRAHKIVLLRMPVGMDEGVKTFIGTLIISQLLKAVWLRQEMPEQERGLFALYCDEFQHFATPDFAKLFTQTGKFRIMPTVAHQERLGQFKPFDPNRGATLAAPNKVLFSLAVADSRELSPEFAKPPPTETRQERELIISQEPVAELLRGHIHPYIRAFVNCYLRPLSEKQEDARDDMEGEKLIRDDLRDQAALERLDAQLEGLNRRASDYGLIRKALQNAAYSIEQARVQTGRLITPGL